MSDVERDYGDSRYYDILDEMRALHRRKAADYGREHDGLANLRASEAFGVPAWVGALIRGNDKMGRLQVAAGGSTLANEGIEDSLIDLAAYAILALILFREERQRLPVSGFTAFINANAHQSH